jgi:hypothetical protein
MRQLLCRPLENKSYARADAARGEIVADVRAAR